MYLDSTLNKWRPLLTQTGDNSWQLRVNLEGHTFLDFRVRGSVFKIVVTIGPAIYSVGSSQFQTFGQKHDLPIEDVVTAMIERWRFLNLVAEF